jgi:hypothetical protein
MKLFKKAFIPFLFLPFFAGCSQNAIDKSLQLFPGEKLVLQQTVTIEPNSATRFIQNGKFTTRSGFDRSEPHCRLEVKEVKETEQSVQPDTFEVTRVQINEEEVAQSHPTNIQLAANDIHPYFSIGIGVGNGAVGGVIGLGGEIQPTETMDTVELYLHSNKQPQVLRLVCAGALSDGNLLDAPRSYRPDFTTINKILGPIGHLEKP